MDLEEIFFPEAETEEERRQARIEWDLEEEFI